MTNKFKKKIKKKIPVSVFERTKKRDFTPFIQLYNQ